MAAGGQVVKDRLGTQKPASRGGTKRNEDIHIDRGHRLQIEGRGDRPAELIAFNDPIRLHAIDNRKGVFELHRVASTCVTYLVARSAR
jgi:hypothetical protein